MKETMQDAYRAAKRIMDETLPQEDRELLREVQDADVIVVRGQYDRVQDVLKVMQIPHRKVNPAEVAMLSLSLDQMLIANCPGQVPRAAIPVIRDFVHQGGALLTTDWALRHLLEPAFPGTVAYNERPTGDEVVRVEVLNPSHPYLEGVFAPGADPVWWLEASSYPIRILDAARVRVLLASAELGARHGEPAVAVQFRAGEGEVVHMISHYYLQRTETRTARHAGTWKSYASETGAVGLAAMNLQEFDDLTVADVEAAHTTLGLMSKLIVGSQRRKRPGR